MTSPPPHETFHAPGVVAELSWQGWRCSLQLCVDAASGIAEGPVTCELLLQPLDARRLPAGPVVRLASQRVWLRADERRNSWTGRVWLPAGISFDLARNCYYRLTPI